MAVSHRVLLLGPAVGAALLISAQAQPDPDVTALVNAAAAYVKTYQEQLTSVVADESYLQQIIMLVPNDPAMPRQRRMNSELVFMFAPTGEWMAIRDVIRVDGQAVKDRPSIVEQLKRLPLHEVADSFLKHNSRFNLGRTYRNFNEPTLVLHVLADAHRSRFSFERTRVARAREGTLVTVAFVEGEGPTSLIRDLTFGAALSRGEFVVEADTGRIRRATLTAKAGPVRLEFTTEFALDDRIGIWVPRRFRERYEHGTPPTSFEGAFEYEDITCDATYSNYRRFQTSGRIKKD
jgi:hypothetical protein